MEEAGVLSRLRAETSSATHAAGRSRLLPRTGKAVPDWLKTARRLRGAMQVARHDGQVGTVGLSLTNRAGPASPSHHPRGF